jgi:hypothetical protein
MSFNVVIEWLLNNYIYAIFNTITLLNLKIYFFLIDFVTV